MFDYDLHLMITNIRLPVPIPLFDAIRIIELFVKPNVMASRVIAEMSLYFEVEKCN